MLQTMRNVRDLLEYFFFYKRIIKNRENTILPVISFRRVASKVKGN